MEPLLWAADRMGLLPISYQPKHPKQKTPEHVTIPRQVMSL